jgi:hypothetical protein
MMQTSGLTGVRPLIAQDDRFARDYDHRSFLFEHAVDVRPLFEIPSLLDLSRRLAAEAAEAAYWSNGHVAFGDDWEKNRASRLSLPDTIANIEHNDSLVLLKHVKSDPIYGPLLSELLDFFVARVGPLLKDDIVGRRAVILISSPGRVTPYHFDAECNYVVQVTGAKTLRVYDQTDRTLLTERELERFHGGDTNAAVYDPARLCDAATYEIHGGLGVHVPTHAPHSAVVHDDVSVALSIHYELRSTQRLSDVYWLNNRLRALGMSPRPPGRSPQTDGAKAMLAHAARGARRLLKGGGRRFS